MEVNISNNLRHGIKRTPPASSYRVIQSFNEYLPIKSDKG